MKLTNLTSIPNKTVKAILADLGIDKADREIAIMVEEGLEAEGECTLLVTGKIIVSLSKDHDIPTLAHELKHAEQYISGLYEWVNAEKQLAEYDDQWHEIEAHEYESKYRVS